MLVYGDRERRCDPRAALHDLVRALDALAADPRPGLAHHGALAGAFVEAGELAQGLADAAREAAGPDEQPEGRTELGDAAMRVLAALAAALARSWDGRPVGAPELRAARAAAAALGALALPASIAPRTAEGHAYYGLYPEAYLEAARAAVATAPGPRRVVGLRSIGAGLAAVVAGACGAPLPATVRPRGEPYRRRARVAPALAREWAGGATIAIVDEGPGLSGSSFAAAIDAVIAAGVPEAGIELYPSHAGAPGPAASDEIRARWRRLPRRLELGVPARVAARALAELAGPLDAPPEDISGGAWRAHHFPAPAAWPPVVAHQERYKLLARAGRARWLAKFAGLGRAGEHALGRARALAAAGFAPEVAGLGHGFLVERWLDDAAPLDPRQLGRGRIDRGRLVEHVGAYLALRRRAFPAEPSRGAPAARLLEMVRRNAALALEPEAGLAAAARWRGRLADLDARARPIEVDARLHPWEWLVTPSGRIVKTDGVDHHAGHDLVGCQDVAWDVAGAIVELELEPGEARRLAAIAGSVDPELLAFLHPAYLAFQLGRCALAEGAAAPDEAARLRTARVRYTGLLRATLAR